LVSTRTQPITIEPGFGREPGVELENGFREGPESHAESAIPSLFRWHLGVVLWRAWPLVQVAELGGAGAVSALVVAGNVLFAEVALGLRRGRRIPIDVAVTTAVLLVIVAGGLAGAGQVQRAEAREPELRVGLLQPNFAATPLEERGRRGGARVRTLREATRELARRGAQLIVWPETTWPFLFDRELGHVFRGHHPWSLGEWGASRLVVGAATHRFGTGLLYNSALLVDPSGAIKGRYDKERLLAFSEYVPFQKTFPRFGEAVWSRLRDRHPMTAGKDATLLADGTVRAGVLICSEELDASLAARRYLEGANLLVGMANDAWFGGGGAAHQHLALAAYRAVETRRALVHVTTTGVSAVVDPVGRVRLEGPVFAVSEEDEREPTLLLAELPLVEGAALGPYTVRYFWLACGLVLILDAFLRRPCVRPGRVRRLSRRELPRRGGQRGRG
jgi:apolipoprotein N-acyltransferase